MANSNKRVQIKRNPKGKMYVEFPVTNFFWNDNKNLFLPTHVRVYFPYDINTINAPEVQIYLDKKRLTRLYLDEWHGTEMGGDFYEINNDVYYGNVCASSGSTKIWLDVYKKGEIIDALEIDLLGELHFDLAKTLDAAIRLESEKRVDTITELISQAELLLD